jgi:putative transposase
MKPTTGSQFTLVATAGVGYVRKCVASANATSNVQKSIGKATPRQGQQVVERIGDTEARKVDDRLHRIARRIVEDAEERNAVVVVGDLGGIRKDKDKGRYVNDRTYKMPSARLSNYIEYNAHDAGIDVQLVEEHDTSKTCKRCACEGVRETQGRFECPEWGLDDNADKNGALNVGKRALGEFSKQLSEAGAVLARPETQVIVRREGEPANLPFPWVQLPVREPHGSSRGRVSVPR